MKKLNVLLGAGFSKPAGLPLATEINAYFLEDVRDRLERLASGEWIWCDLSGIKLEGRVRTVPDHLPFSYILYVLVNRYIVHKGGFKDYEDFYQWVLDSIEDDGFVDSILIESRSLLEVDYPKKRYSTYHEIFNRGGMANEIAKMLHGLISSLLILKMSAADIRTTYRPFVDFIWKYDQVNIFSLNHDILVETIFAVFGLNFCDGFTIANSSLISKIGNEPQPVYSGYSGLSKFNLIKLHGGVDILAYKVGKQVGSSLDLTGEIIFYKPTSHLAKFTLKRVDIQGNIVQSINPPSQEVFLTGLNKVKSIAANFYYKNVFAFFKRKIITGDLLVVGYGFRDKHVNKVLKRALYFNCRKRIINVNLKNYFPFKVCRSIEWLQDISKLK